MTLPLSAVDAIGLVSDLGEFESGTASSAGPLLATDQLALSRSTGLAQTTVGDVATYVQGTFGQTPNATEQGSAKVGFLGPEVNEVPYTVYLNLIETVKVSRYNVTPGQTNTINTAQLQKAIASKNRVRLVFRDGDYHVNGSLSTNPNTLVYFEGDGGGITRLVQDNLTSDLLTFNLGYAQGGGLCNMTLTGNVTSQGAEGSTGTALRVTNANGNFVVDGFEILSFDTGIELNGSFYPTFKNGQILYFAKYGIHLTPYTGASSSSTAGSRWSGLKISNFGYTGANPQNSIGIFIEQASGEYLDVIDITQTGRGIVVAPPSGSSALFLKFKTVLADTSLYEGWTFDGTNAPVVNMRMVDCYAAGSGGGVLRPVNSTRGAGILTLGSNLDDLNWAGGEIRDNDCGGWDHQGGSNCRLTAGTSVTRNSRRVVQSWETNPPSTGNYSNVYPGIHVHAGVSDWAVVGCDVGNFSMGVFNALQAEGIVIDAGTSDRFRVVGNNLNNPGPGKQCISNGSTAVSYIIDNNIPTQTLATNIKSGQHISCATLGTVAPSTTTYIGCNAQQPVEIDTQVLIHHVGIITQVIVHTLNTGPGAGVFVYTLFLNGEATSITGTLTGSNQILIMTGNSVNVNPGDAVSLQLVTSSSASTTRHQIAITVNG